MSTTSGRTSPLRVSNTGFLLDRLGQDCHPLQFLRELTQNSIEAIQRSGGAGEIVWDVDWNGYDLADSPVFKLSITDSGDGMTGDDLQRYINQLSSSGNTQSMAGNYGVGAKIAAATRNHHGLIYMSWREGHGSMIHLWRDPESGQYGLRQFETADGLYPQHVEVEDDIKPSLIGDHGTMVVLLGNALDEDTMKAPEGSPSPSRWIAKYLNSRYYRIPEGIRIRAREGWEHHRSDHDRNLLRTIVGQEAYLQSHSEASGTVRLSGAVAHWWVLKNESAVTNNSGWIESAGHTAALYRDELYEMATARAGRAQLQTFGVLLGTNRVVLYVQPDDSSITTNTARTLLLRGGEPLPWADWAHEFQQQMPREIQDLMDSVGAASTAQDHSKSIQDRLKDLLDLFRVSRYRPSVSGSLEADPSRLGGGVAASRRYRGQTQRSGSVDGGTGGSAGGVYSFFLKQGGTPADPVKGIRFPNPVWVSVTDGSRVPGDIEDRAARYLFDQNVLLINADFRVFRDMVDRYRKELNQGTPVAPVIEEAVRNWFEQALFETVIGIQALKDSKEWTTSDVESALSEESLTAAVMQRYHVYNAVRRELGSKLGRLRRD